MDRQYLLAIDQGTTSSRAILFNQHSHLIGSHGISLTQSFPELGWVEQNPEEMFNNTVKCCHEVLKKVGISVSAVVAIGISNQRETTIIWDKKTGKPIYPAIVWQDRRTKDLCREIARTSIAKHIQEKTGLILDPYFSATKIMWLLDNVPSARLRAERGELLFGTVDTYLLWELTGGKSHYTDATNASRTMLFNIKEQQWDKDLLTTFNIPENLLPQVLDNAADFGMTEEKIFGGAIQIAGMAGDQQAATIGQTCFTPGTTKVTFGTGGFLLMNTGHLIVQSSQGLLSTVAYRLNNKVTYGLEGSFFSADVSIQWLRDTLKIIKSAAETELLAASLKDNGGVYLVPAFTGLGAPYWKPDAHGAIVGLTRDSGPAHLARAALESVAYQTQDLLLAMAIDYPTNIPILNVDGGMAVNNWLIQFLADITNINIARPACTETSALGVAYLAGLQMGIFKSLDDIKQQQKMDHAFKPQMPIAKVKKLYSDWQQAVKRIAD